MSNFLWCFRRKPSDSTHSRDLFVYMCGNNSQNRPVPREAELIRSHQCNFRSHQTRSDKHSGCDLVYVGMFPPKARKKGCAAYTGELSLDLASTSSSPTTAQGCRQHHSRSERQVNTASVKSVRRSAALSDHVQHCVPEHIVFMPYCLRPQFATGMHHEHISSEGSRAVPRDNKNNEGEKNREKLSLCKRLRPPTAVFVAYVRHCARVCVGREGKKCRPEQTSCYVLTLTQETGILADCFRVLLGYRLRCGLVHDNLVQVNLLSESRRNHREGAAAAGADRPILPE